MVRVLILSFETPCVNRPFCDKHENVIFAKNSFIFKKKAISVFKL